MKVYLGADHGGFEIKEKIEKWLLDQDFEVEDMGADELNTEDDFVDFSVKVATKVADDGGMGILFCRNGVGMCIVANRFVGVRCALGFDRNQVEKARNDDDVNVLSLPADYLDEKKTKELIETFLKTEFSSKERYKRRLKKIRVLEGECCGSESCSCE